LARELLGRLAKIDQQKQRLRNVREQLTTLSAEVRDKDRLDLLRQHGEAILNELRREKSDGGDI
jgi:hypothetical protein